MTAAAILVLGMLCFPIIIFSAFATAALRTIRAVAVAIIIGSVLNILWFFIVGTMTPEEYNYELPYHVILFSIALFLGVMTGLLLRLCLWFDKRADGGKTVAQLA